MRKAQKITLQQVDLKVSAEGSMKRKALKQKSYPVRLTKEAIQMGEKSGLLTEEQLSASFKKIGSRSFSNKNRKGRDTTIISKKIDVYTVDPVDRITPYIVIYLSFISANPKQSIPFGEFMKMFRYSYSHAVEIYSNLVGEYMSRSRT